MNTTGPIQLDLEEIARLRITIFSLRGDIDFFTEIRAAGVHTVALLLALLRKLHLIQQHALAGGWNRYLSTVREPHRKRAGIIAYGHLGRMAARYLTVFGMYVQATRPNLAQIDCVSDFRAVSCRWKPTGRIADCLSACQLNPGK
jgi:phosphoglycerate dehydrogenase-like enzyme